MKISVLVLALMSGIGLVMAGDGCGGGKECQCLFSDGSHCCVYGDNGESGDTGNCEDVCRNAVRVRQNGESQGTACNANGRFSCVSVWNAQWRTPCYNNNNDG